ncbi:MAG: glycosyltransferase family 4 protein [Pseudomonadota bacterium]
MPRPLRIAFYAPLKDPDHPVPSGDRLMARMLVACLQAAGHRVTVMSRLRAYLRDPDDAAGWAALQTAAAAEVVRLGHVQADLWFTYHPYYKSPDLIGPSVCAKGNLPYVTCEASYSSRRNLGVWAAMQAQVLQAVQGAALNLCLTDRDRVGLLAAAPRAVVARLPPFIDEAPFAAPPTPRPGHLVTVAMMRAGDKAQSYALLAQALALLPEGLDWHLTVAGDGPLRSQVQAMFGNRVTWAGQMDRAGVAALLATGAVYVWPGCGEAYGLAYLEAQAAGLPVVAMAVAGVPEVVTDGVTGFLLPDGDAAGMAAAIERLLTDADLRGTMGRAARGQVQLRHTMQGATRRLDTLLQGVVA